MDDAKAATSSVHAAAIGDREPVSVFIPPGASGRRRRCGAPRPYAGRSRGGTAPSSPRRPISDVPAGISPYSPGQPGHRHICTLTVALNVSPHARLSHHGVHDRTLDSKRTHSHRARTRRCAWPAPPHRHPSCLAASQTGTSRTIRHPGQCSTSPPQPGAALRLIAPPLFGAALVHACLCTSLHRCTPRTAPLSMRSAAPCGSA